MRIFTLQIAKKILAKYQLNLFWLVTPVNSKVNTKSYSNRFTARIHKNIFSCHSKICHVVLISLKGFRKTFCFQRTLLSEDQNTFTEKCQVFKFKMLVHVLKFGWSIFFFVFQPLSWSNELCLNKTKTKSWKQAFLLIKWIQL